MKQKNLPALLEKKTPEILALSPEKIMKSSVDQLQSEVRISAGNAIVSARKTATRRNNSYNF